MAKGSRPGGSTGRTITEFSEGKAGTINLRGMPLKYGGTDKTLSGDARVAVERFENAHRGAKVEYAQTYNASGLVTESTRGGKTSVKTTVTAISQAETYSHIHPRAAGVLGGTFSAQDMQNFTGFNVKTFRAAAKEGTYSISKGKNFKGKEFMSYYSKAERGITAKAKLGTNRLTKMLKSGKMSYEAYSKAYDTVNNKMLVDLHNTLLKGQKAYGYTYTLEGRK